MTIVFGLGKMLRMERLLIYFATLGKRNSCWKKRASSPKDALKDRRGGTGNGKGDFISNIHYMSN